MIILSVDPGFVPLVYALYDADWKRFLHLGTFHTPKDKRSAYNAAEQMRRLCALPAIRRHSPDLVLVEQQMKKGLVAQVVALQTLFPGRCLAIAPSSVKHALFPERNRQSSGWKDNKSDAVWFIEQWTFHGMGMRYAFDRMPILKKKKRHPHDLADAMLLSLYYEKTVLEVERQDRQFLDALLSKFLGGEQATTTEQQKDVSIRHYLSECSGAIDDCHRDLRSDS